HLDGLKSVPNVSDAPLKEKLKELQDAFHTVERVPLRDRPKIGPLHKLDWEDISSFEDVIKMYSSDTTLSFRSLPTVMKACSQLIDEAQLLYKDYTCKTSQVPAGLTEYIAYQNQLQD